MKQRQLSEFTVSAIGLGCMGLSHAYGEPIDREAAKRVLGAALDLGYTFFDTATIYGNGANEELIGETIAHRRSDYVLASKCGLYVGQDGRREIDGTPARIKRACEDSLRRLRTDVIDIYYLHRLDRSVPIEESVGALAELVAEGKIRAIGLSEMSAATVRRAHAVHPIAALQSEYSLWTRNPEIATLDMCRELGIAFVAFSPLGRGSLGGTLRPDDVTNFAPRDLRRAMPRFAADNYRSNYRLIEACQPLADEAGCSPAQLALAWLLAKGGDIVPIPGTTSLAHLEENMGAADVVLDEALVARLDALINEATVAGERYAAAQQRDIDTETFAPEPRMAAAQS